jgi:excisionase family DNA binding protein
MDIEKESIELFKKHMKDVLPVKQFDLMLQAFDNSNNGLLTTSQASEILGCSRHTVYRMVEDKTLDPIYLRPGNVKTLRFSSKQIFEIINK